MKGIKKPNINLFIVGAAKSGTTSLYNYLEQHSEVFFPKVKEPNYYSGAESHNPSAYLKPKKGVLYHNKIIRDKNIYFSLYEEAKDEKVIGDASPSYLWDKSSAKLIHDDYPNAKIIIILRNPISRAYSQFLMDIRDGNQTEENFLKALDIDKKVNPHNWGRAHLYEEIGMYYEQVLRYINLFEKNCKVIFYEDFIKNTKEVLLELFYFLEINQDEIQKIDYNKVHNTFKVPKNSLSKVLIKYKNKVGLIKFLVPTSVKRKLNKDYLFKKGEKPKISPEAKQYLQGIYLEDIEKLENFFKVNLDKWKS